MEYWSQFIALFQKGGFVMYPLLLCSIFVAAIVLDRLVYFRASETETKVLVSAISKLASDQWAEAEQICKAAKGFTAAITAKALNRPGAELPVLQNMLEGEAAFAVAKMRERLNYLDTIVTGAPLLGLLGTVSGMIQSFSVMTIRAGQPQAITGGVGEALVATATGLCVALFALAAHSYFVQRLDRAITGMERVFSQLIEASSRRSR
jgi:biopolymer transport protein ExbB